MKIEDVRIRRFTMERLDPAWRTASYSAKGVDGFVIQIIMGNFIGIGATAAHPNSISPDYLEQQLTGPVKRACLGQDPLFRTAICANAASANIHPRARIALDLALYDILGKIAGLP